MELLISLFFFSLASAVCISLFVKSHTIGNRTIELNYGINYAQNLAEAFYSCDGDLEKVALLFPNSIMNTASNTIEVSFDQHYGLVTVNQDSESNLLNVEISIYSYSTNEDPIYSLYLTYYQAERLSL